MRAWAVLPGVTAAGHVTAGGHWHPGSEQTCTKDPCSTDYGPGMPVTETKFPEGGYGELYCPWCSATLLAVDLDPLEVAAGHKREAGHTGRPVQINRALRLSQLSRTDVKP